MAPRTRLRVAEVSQVSLGISSSTVRVVISRTPTTEYQVFKGDTSRKMAPVSAHRMGRGLRAGEGAAGVRGDFTGEAAVLG
ncbi:transcriptional regulator [Pseudomonas chlororaphis subsp. aurantiaca]|nr:transcriptional regulator [Pseudomonas chlororaphis subsp. aurantiaca]